MIRRKNMLHFEDGLKRNRPAAFGTMVKPAGSSCNMGCGYCYYLDKGALYEGRVKYMDDELLENYIRQYIEANQTDTVTFCWHGGEPLLAGPDFYRRAIALQQKYADGKRIENTLQTNGLLVDDVWCDFFRENEFLVGVSIDGPKDIHDAYRVTKASAPTFDRVMEAVVMMKAKGVEYNTLSVVSDLSEGRGAEIYRFLKSIGSRYMQFLPVVEYVAGDKIVSPASEGSAHRAAWSVSSAGYGRFLNDIFDEWVTGDVGNYFVQMFDVALAQWMGVPPPLCAFSDTCGDSLVVEHNGDVYSCDHFVYPEFKLGNIAEQSLLSMYKSKRQFDFGLSKRSSLPAKCLRCGYYFACRGECPKHRFETTDSGEAGLNSLCEGLYAFFKHADPYMKYMADLLRREQPPSYVIPWARARMGLNR